MKDVLAKAGKEAATAPKGSPAQQVGTLYNAYLDLAARDAAGIAPLKPYLDEIDAVKDFNDLARLSATFAEAGGPGLFLLIGPDIDFVDNKRYMLFASDGGLGLPEQLEDVFDEADGGPRITAYRTYLIEMQKIAGQSGDRRRRGSPTSPSGWIAACMRPS